jgi:hypothetical protein
LSHPELAEGPRCPIPSGAVTGEALAHRARNPAGWCDEVLRQAQDDGRSERRSLTEHLTGSPEEVPRQARDDDELGMTERHEFGMKESSAPPCCVFGRSQPRVCHESLWPSLAGSRFPPHLLLYLRGYGLSTHTARGMRAHCGGGIPTGGAWQTPNPNPSLACKGRERIVIQSAAKNPYLEPFA